MACMVRVCAAARLPKARRRWLSAGAIDGVPGLYLCQGVLPDADEVRTAAESVWTKVADAAWAHKHSPHPQRTHRSQNHNLPEERQYRNITFVDRVDENYFEPDLEDGFSMTGRDSDMLKPGKPTMCAAQYFEEYGGAGHSLAYFLSTGNIPYQLRDTLLPVVAYCVGEMVAREYRDPEALDWRLTMNAYTNFDTGFPYHKDIAANGEVTAIFSIGMPSTLELCPERDGATDPPAASVTARDNSLIILSGEARWEWIHRVQPMKSTRPQMLFGDVNRMSLVLGATPK